MRRPRTVPDGTPPPSDPPPQPHPPTGPGRITDEEYLTVAEVAALWHVDRDSVYRAIYAGDLPWVDLRGKGASRPRIRVRSSAAHRYMADRERQVRAA